MTKTRIAIVTAALLIVALTVAGVCAGRGKPELSTEVSGNPSLIADVRGHLGGVRDSLAICEANGNNTSQAFFGSSGVQQYEIASLSKVITGELLADAVRRGEVTLASTVSEYLDLQGSPVADATLSELATHTSGLGYWGDDDRDGGLGSWWTETIRGDVVVHDMSLSDLLDRARKDPMSTRGVYSYSNIGFALLGQVLAQASGMDYPDLLRARVTGPLGMKNTRLGSSSDRNRMRGYSAAGRRVPAWNLGVYGPSGGILSTPDDMCRFASFLAASDFGTGKETSARAPIAVDSFGNGSGLGWNIRQVKGTRVAWKEGQTGGYASAVVAFEGYSLVILSNTAVNLDSVAWDLVEKRAPLG